MRTHRAIKTAWLWLAFLLMLLAASCSTGSAFDDDAAGDDVFADDDAADDTGQSDDTFADDTGDDTADDALDDDTDFGFIVFEQNNDAGFNIARVGSLMGEITALTNTQGHLNVRPAISPDGTTVAFASNLHDPDPGINFATMIYTMPASGGDAARLTAEDWHQTTETTPAFSPDGALLAYVRSNSVDPPANVDRIWIWDFSLGDRYAIYPDDLESHNDWAPSFSPDAGKLVFISDSELTVADLYIADLTQDPATKVRLTASDPFMVTSLDNPFFDSTGQWVYFTSTRNGLYGLYKIPAAGGNPELVWQIGFTDSGPYLDMPAYAGLRLANDNLHMAGYTVLNGRYQVAVFGNYDPVPEARLVTGLDIDASDPAWWRPSGSAK